ncbi:hypothetical protein [Armatimonas rosea]|uniref:Uncharacterized protein n=1 Tax=Armatimonas rosea TaxID=685828 RepID=A0A7W9SQ62_ARMRO|nr:hypothetical protein [Armatimonas rosea]MBB6050751.1 hypothetical protein [Armatimonas rosea]
MSKQNDDEFYMPSGFLPPAAPTPRTTSPRSAPSSGCGCWQVAGWLFVIFCLFIFFGIRHLEQEVERKERAAKAYFASPQYQWYLNSKQGKEDQKRGQESMRKMIEEMQQNGWRLSRQPWKLPAHKPSGTK